MADAPSEASSTDRDQQEDSGAAELIPLWRLPIFGDRIPQVPAFLVPRLTEMANELPNTGLDRRIYYERVHALLAVASGTFKKDFRRQGNVITARPGPAPAAAMGASTAGWPRVRCAGRVPNRWLYRFMVRITMAI